MTSEQIKNELSYQKEENRRLKYERDKMKERYETRSAIFKYSSDETHTRLFELTHKFMGPTRDGKYGDLYTREDYESLKNTFWVKHRLEAEKASIYRLNCCIGVKKNIDSWEKMRGDLHLRDAAQNPYLKINEYDVCAEIVDVIKSKEGTIFVLRDPTITITTLPYKKIRYHKAHKLIGRIANFNMGFRASDETYHILELNPLPFTIYDTM